MSDETEDADAAGPPEESELTLTFDPPIKVRAATYSEMTLREPTGKMVKQAEGRLRGGINVESLRLYQLALIVSISGWPADAVEELPIREIDKASRFIERFTNLGQAIGLR